MADLSQDRVVSNNQKLYNNLLKSGKVTQDEIGDFDTFNTLLSDTSNASKLRDNLISKKNFSEAELGSHDDFLQNLDPPQLKTLTQPEQPLTFMQKELRQKFPENYTEEILQTEQQPVKPLGKVDQLKVDYLRKTRGDEFADQEQAKMQEPEPVIQPTELQEQWAKENPKLNAVFSLPGMGIFKEAYIGTKKAIGGLGTTLDVIAENISNEMTGGLQWDENGKPIPWVYNEETKQWSQGKKIEKSDFYKAVRKFEEETPVSSGGATAFLGQLLPQTSALAATVLLRSPNATKAYLASMYGSSFGNGVETYDDYIRETGKQENPTDRYLVGMGYGAAEYIGEKIGLDYFMPKGYGKLVAKSLDASPQTAKEIGKSVLENYAKITKQSLPSVLKKVAIGSQVEGGQEVATELMDIAIDKWLTGKDVSGQEIRDRLVQSYGGGALMGAGITPFAQISQTAANTQRRREQGSVTISIDEQGLPVELINTEDKVIGIRPDGEEVKNISQATLDKAATFKTEQFEAAIKEFSKTNKITTATIEGQQYTINNPEDLGIEGKPIFAKDAEGNVIPVQNYKVENPVTQTLGEIEQANQQQAEQAKLYEGISDPNAQILEEINEEGIRLVNFSNGQSKIITSEGEIIANNEAEKDRILEAVVKGEPLPQPKVTDTGEVIQPAPERKVITQTIGKTPIDIIEGEEYDEIVPTEKVPLEKALPVLEKKFKDNEDFELQVEKVQVEEPGETKYDKPVKKTVIKSIRIVPKQSVESQEAEQKKQIDQQNQVHNKVVNMVNDFNSLSDAGRRKANTADIVRMASELGYNVKTDNSGKLIVTDKGKQIGLRGRQKSAEEIQSHPTLTDYSPEIQETAGYFLNPMSIQDVDLAGIPPLQAKQAILDIQAGKKTVAANDFLDAIENIYNTGIVSFKANRQTGFPGAEIPLEEYMALMNEEDPAAENMSDEQADFILSLTEDELLTPEILNQLYYEITGQETTGIAPIETGINEAEVSEKRNLKNEVSENISQTSEQDIANQQIDNLAIDESLQKLQENEKPIEESLPKPTGERSITQEGEDATPQEQGQGIEEELEQNVNAGDINVGSKIEELNDYPELKKEPSLLNVSDKAAQDIEGRPNLVKTLDKISSELGEPVNIINSEEIPPSVSELKKQIKEGNRVPAFFLNGQVYILSDQIQSVSDAVKSYIHETIIHKGLRNTFAQADKISIIGKQYAKLNDLLVDVFGSMSRSQKMQIANLYTPGLYENGRLMRKPTEEEKALIGEEFLAHVSENPEIYDGSVLTKFQEWINRLAQIIRKAFRLTSNQFSQNDLLDIIREQRRRMGERTEFNKDVSDEIKFKVSENPEENNLVAVHNIKPEGLLNADKIGGLPMPSIAIIDINHGFSSYGEISLVANKDMIDPQKNRYSNVFASDVYSARYPSVSYDIPRSGTNKIVKKVQSVIPKEIASSVSYNIEHDIESNGLKELKNSRYAELLFLLDGNRGFEYKITEQKHPESVIQSFIENGWKNIDPFDIRNNKEVKQKITDLYFSEKDFSSEAKRFLSEDGLLNENLMRDFINSVQREIRESGKIDLTETLRSADKFVSENNLKKEFEEYISDFYKDLDIKEKIFKGFNRHGYRIYSPHTLENVLKAMKKDGIRAGESSFYGAGSIRAQVTPQFKSLKEIKSNRGRIQEGFDKVKEEINDELFKVLDDIKKFYKYDSSNFSYSQNAGEELPILAKRGLSESFNKLDEEAQKKVNDFISKLANLPTDYFEAKINRGVSLAEFKNALIPEDTNKDVRDVLKFNGINAVEYKDNTDRAEKLKQLADEKELRFRIIGETGARNLDKTEEATTRLDNLAIAREMEQAGKDVKSIRLATGWEKGVDGKWRYETTDHDLSFNKKSLEELKNNQALSNKAHEFSNLTYRKNQDGTYDFSMMKKGATSTSDFASYKNIPDKDLEYIFDNNTELISKVRSGEGEESIIGYFEPAKEITMDFEHYVSGGMPLVAVIENKEVFKEYPQLKNTVVVYNPEAKTQGSFGKDLDGQDVITVKSIAGPQFKSTLLHEIQHNIQDIEGFAKGGNPNDIVEIAAQLFDKGSIKSNMISVTRLLEQLISKRSVINKMLTAYNEGKINKEFVENFIGPIKEAEATVSLIADLVDAIGGKDNKKAFDIYKRIAGEVESRNVQSRMNMTPEERLNTLLSETEDVAREDQIVLMDGLGVSNLEDLSLGEKPMTIDELKADKNVFWHGSPSGDMRGSAYGLHIGTHEAAKQALEARIGVKADGSDWDGTEEYGKTLLAGKKTLAKPENKWKSTGFNAGSDVPENDYYPKDRVKKSEYSDRTVVSETSKPNIQPVRIIGEMSNSPRNPHEDFKANGYMKAAITKGNAKRGYYYENVGEDSGSISAVVPNSSHIKVVSVKPSQPNTILIDGVSRPTLNSNGKPIAQTEEGIRNFWKWFSGSRIVDETGKPLVVYHGTPSENDFNEFSNNVQRNMLVEYPEAKGFYFTSNINNAYGYSNNGSIMPVYLRILNPIISSIGNKHVTIFPNEFDEIVQNGYDGFVFNKFKEVVAFYPNQIKSATGNDGSFSPETNDIRFRIEQERENVNTEPSEAQRLAGNYQKGHVRFDGFDISIENPKGSVRSGVDKTGREWSQVLPADYGYFRGTVGKDKDHVDVFIGSKPEASNIYIIDQIDPETGKFDEHKVMLGFDSQSKAKQTYLAAFEPGWKGLGQITRTDKQGLKEWFESGDMKKPFSDNNVVRFRVESFYSPTEKALNSIQQNKGSVEQFKAMLLKNGAKQAEMDWMGFDEAFPDGKKSVTKVDIQNWIDQNKIEVKEVVKGTFKPDAVNENDVVSVRFKQFGSGSYVVSFKGDIGDIEISTSEADSEEEAIQVAIERANYDNTEYVKEKPKFSQYVEPGGSNYKELLLTLPVKYRELSLEEFAAKMKKPISEVESAYRLHQQTGGYKDYAPGYENQFKSSHFDEPNILAHIRFDERTDSEGNKVLFIEEIQSDWAQKGKKDGFKKPIPTDEQITFEYGEYWVSLPGEEEGVSFSTKKEAKEYLANLRQKNNNGVPSMPFSKTDQWVNLAFRRMMLYAAENGFDKIAWTNGEMQAARYDLSKQVDYISTDITPMGRYVNISPSTGMITVKVDNNGIVDYQSGSTNYGDFVGKPLSDIIGKEISERILNSPDGTKLEGEGLKIGGEGMKAFYDNIIPSAANKLGKPFGAKVEETTIGRTGSYEDMVALGEKAMKEMGLTQAQFDALPIEKRMELTNKKVSVQSLPVTEQMKNTVKYEGVPLFRIVPRDESIDKLREDLNKVSRFRTASKNDFLKSVNETVESNMNESYGIKKTPLWERVKQKLAEIKESTQHFQHITEKDFPEVYDKLRQFESIPDRVKKEAFERVSKIVRPLIKSEEHMRAFERYIVLQDLVHDVEETDLFTGKELPWGYNTVEEIKQDMRNARAYVMRTPEVLKAIRERQAMMREVKKELVDAKLLKDNGNNDYFHHQVLAFMEGRANVGVSAKDVRNHKKGWQRSRQGSIALYNTNYIESEFEVMAQSLEQLAIKNILGEINESINIMPKLVEKAKKDGGNWKDYIPEGYKFWFPKPGTNAYKAASMAERAVQNILADPDNPELQEILAEAEGSMWVIPEPVAKQLDAMKDREKENVYAEGLRAVTGKWKQWTLLNPFRAAKYNFNNTSGDLDVVLAYNPKILQKKYAHKAMTEAWNEMTGKGMSEDMKEALKYGIITSGLSIQEIPDINNQSLFRSITGGQGNFAKRTFGRVLGGYWQGVTAFTQFRENVLRVAAYKFFKDQINQGNRPLGASNQKAVQALYDSKASSNEIAGKLARELMGDYGNLSQAGQWLRAHSFPFWSWVEINAPRYYKMLQNTKFEGNSGVIGQVVGVGAKKTAVNMGMLGVRAMLMMGLVVLWNQLMFPDEDEELQKMGDNKLKLIVGRRDDGSIITIKIQGAFSDVLSFFSLEDAVSDVKELNEGKTTPKKKAIESGSAFVNKFAQGAMPMTRGAMELAMGKTLYPDVFNPRVVRDRGENIARLVSMDKVYNYLTHKPVRPFGKEVSSLLVYDNNPGEAAYYTMREKINEFLKDNDEDSPSIEPSDKSNALYYYKKSLKLGDEKNAKFWFDKYRELGGTGKGYTSSMKKGILINSVPKELRAEWVKSLDAEDKEILDLANRWYMETYLKVGIPVNK